MRRKIKNNFPFLKDQNRFVYIFLTLPLLQILTKIFNKKKSSKFNIFCVILYCMETFFIRLNGWKIQDKKSWKIRSTIFILKGLRTPSCQKY